MSAFDFSEIDQTRREGTRHPRTVHIHGWGLSTGTAGGYPPVPTEGAVPIAQRADDALRAFGARLSSAPAAQSREHACAFVARLPLVPLSVAGVWLESPRAQVGGRSSCAHDLMLVTVSNDYVCRWQAAEHISSEGAGRDYLTAWFGSLSNWWQLVS